MIPQAYITAWRSVAPWPDDAQVEQDLVLSRAVVELFNIPELSGKLALRGGTALNRLFVAEPVRYSEDIDLVQVVPGLIGPILDAVRAKLDPWLGVPKRSVSQMISLTYRFESEIAPVRTLRLKIEMNSHPARIANCWLQMKLRMVFDYLITEQVGRGTSTDRIAPPRRCSLQQSLEFTRQPIFPAFLRRIG